MNYDWEEITGKLTKLLRVHNTPIGMKGFHSVEEMSQVPKLRRPKHIHMPCQIIGQAIQCGFTIGFTPEDITTAAPLWAWTSRMTSGERVKSSTAVGAPTLSALPATTTPSPR